MRNGSDISLNFRTFNMISTVKKNGDLSWLRITFFIASSLAKVSLSYSIASVNIKINDINKLIYLFDSRGTLCYFVLFDSFFSIVNLSENFFNCDLLYEVFRTCQNTRISWNKCSINSIQRLNNHLFPRFFRVLIH